MNDWHIFRGNPREPQAPEKLKGIPTPPWRKFRNRDQAVAETYLASPREIQMVNAALYLRRPLLVTGPPGSGKSSLAYAIAAELQLGPVLKWPINSRSVLTDGLYHYDAIARLRDANLKNARGSSKSDHVEPSGTRDANQENSSADGIEDYLKLRSLGTALASTEPRVVLIDEIDKADVDLPNDLLDVLEEGKFTIPELERLSDLKREISLRTSDSGQTSRATVKAGVVQCETFPVIVITSNGERELPPAFLRRCLRLDMELPDELRLKQIVASHLGQAIAQDQRTSDLLKAFVALREQPQVLATDQLLNIVHLVFEGKIDVRSSEGTELQKFILRGLDA